MTHSITNTQAMWNEMDSTVRIRRNMLESNVIRIISDCIDIAQDTGADVMALIMSKLGHDAEALDIADNLLTLN